MTSRRLPLVLCASLSTLAGCAMSYDDSADVGSAGSTLGGDEGSYDSEGGASSDGGDPGDGGGEAIGDGDGDIEPGQLTAGEWRDLDNWDFWLGLADSYEWADEFDAWGLDTRLRVPVFAISDGVPVADTAVIVRGADEQVLWRARTDNQGLAELWPQLLGDQLAWPLTISAGAAEVVLDPSEGPVEQVVLELPAQQPNEVLDLMFMVDTTSSMSDELTYLQAELGDVITQVEAQGGEFDVRLSVNFYRDEGDEYVVRSFPFTTDIQLALDQLADQSSNGGGDIPEAVEQALDDAVFGHEWSESARARLLFLILDAPPHDTPEIRESLEASIRMAAEKGIRVIPVAASGIDKPTEFLLREIDIATGATYVFLTDHSGIGNEHLEPTIGEYTVELFNKLLVRLITESMA